MRTTLEIKGLPSALNSGLGPGLSGGGGGVGTPWAGALGFGPWARTPRLLPLPRVACPGVWAPSPPTVFRLGPGGFLWISAIRRAASDSKSFVFYLIFHVIFSLVTGTGRCFMLLMWTFHVGSCMWYYLVRTEDPTIELAWSFEQRANAGELVVGGNSAGSVGSTCQGHISR